MIRAWLILHRTHRIIGVACAFFTILLAVTGLVLLRTDTWDLDQTRPPLALVRFFYEIPEPKIESYQVEGSFWSVCEENLFLEEAQILKNVSSLKSILKMNFGWALVSPEELIMLDPNGALIDRMKVGIDLPHQNELLGAYLKGESLILQSVNEFYISDDLFTWNKHESLGEQKLLKATKISSALESQILENVSIIDISWERLVLDVHSGRVMGRLGPWIMELSAWGLIALTCTGCMLQFQRSRLKRRRRRR